MNKMLVYYCIPSSYKSARRILRSLSNTPHKIKLLLNTSFKVHEQKLKTINPNIHLYYNTSFLEAVQTEEDQTWIMWGRDQVPTPLLIQTFLQETQTYPESVLGHSGWNYIGVEWLYVDYHCHEVSLLDGIRMTKRKYLNLPHQLFTEEEMATYWRENKVRMDVIEVRVENHVPTYPSGICTKKTSGTPPLIYKSMFVCILLLMIGFVYKPNLTLVPFLVLCSLLFSKFRHMGMYTFNLCWWVGVYIIFMYRYNLFFTLPTHISVGISLSLMTLVSDKKHHWCHLASQSLITLAPDTYIPQFSHPVIYVANYPGDFIEHSIYTFLGENIVVLSSGKMDIACCFIDRKNLLYIPTENKHVDNYQRTVRIIKAQLAKNNSLFAYPEHHYWNRSSQYKMCKFRTGLFRISQELNVPIVPVVVSHFNTLLGLGELTLKLKVLEPIWVKNVQRDTQRCYDKMAKVLDRFKYEI